MNIQTEELYINPFTRTVVDKQGSRIYLTAKEFADGETYLSMMKKNVETLKEALN